MASGFGIPTRLLDVSSFPSASALSASISALPIPPAPSFADFRFQNIGQQPRLLTRFTDPNLGQDGTEDEPMSTSSESDQRLQTAEKDAMPRSRPSLLQALAKPDAASDNITGQASADTSRFPVVETPVLDEQQPGPARSTSKSDTSTSALLRSSSPSHIASKQPVAVPASTTNFDGNAAHQNSGDSFVSTDLGYPSVSPGPSGTNDAPMEDVQPSPTPNQPSLPSSSRKYEDLRQIHSLLQATTRPHDDKPSLTSTILLTNSAQKKADTVHAQVRVLHNNTQEMLLATQKIYAATSALLKDAEEAKGLADSAKADIERISSAYTDRQSQSDHDEIKELLRSLRNWITCQEADEAALRARKAQQLKLKRQKPDSARLSTQPSLTSLNGTSLVTSTTPPISASALHRQPLFFSPTPEVDVKVDPRTWSQSPSHPLSVSASTAPDPNQRQAELRRLLKGKHRSSDEESPVSSSSDIARDERQRHLEEEKRRHSEEARIRREDEEKIREELRKAEERRQEEQRQSELDRQEAERKEREEFKKRSREEAERKAREESERLRLEEKRALEEAEKKRARESLEAMRRARAEAERKQALQSEEAERKAREAEAQRKAQEEELAMKVQEEEAKKKAQEEVAKRKAQEEAQKKRLLLIQRQQEEDLQSELRRAQEKAKEERRKLEEQVRLVEQERQEKIRQDQNLRRAQIQAEKGKTMADRAQQILAQRSHRPQSSLDATSEMSLDSSPGVSTLTIVSAPPASPLTSRGLLNRQPLLLPQGTQSNSSTILNQPSAILNGQTSMLASSQGSPSDSRSLSLPPVAYLSQSDRSHSTASINLPSQRTPPLSVYALSGDNGNVPYRENNLHLSSPQAQAANIRHVVSALNLQPVTSVKTEPAHDDSKLLYPPSRDVTPIQHQITREPIPKPALQHSQFQPPVHQPQQSAAPLSASASQPSPVLPTEPTNNRQTHTILNRGIPSPPAITENPCSHPSQPKQSQQQVSEAVDPMPNQSRIQVPSRPTSAAGVQPRPSQPPVSRNEVQQEPIPQQPAVSQNSGHSRSSSPFRMGPDAYIAPQPTTDSSPPVLDSHGLPSVLPSFRGRLPSSTSLPPAHWDHYSPSPRPPSPLSRQTDTYRPNYSERTRRSPPQVGRKRSREDSPEPYKRDYRDYDRRVPPSRRSRTPPRHTQSRRTPSRSRSPSPGYGTHRPSLATRLGPGPPPDDNSYRPTTPPRDWERDREPHLLSRFSDARTTGPPPQKPGRPRGKRGRGGGGGGPPLPLEERISSVSTLAKRIQEEPRRS